jgi:hypothetical protein
MTSFACDGNVQVSHAKDVDSSTFRATLYLCLLIARRRPLNGVSTALYLHNPEIEFKGFKEH